MKIFVPGRVCLFGEHSDWAGGHRRINSAIEKGYTLLAGTDQGIYAEIEPHPTSLVLRPTTPAGERQGPYETSMEAKTLLEEAQKGGFWSYVAGVAYQGEVTTPSRCGRMDQGCAFGNRPILMTYDGDRCRLEEDRLLSVSEFSEKPTMDYARNNLRVAGLPENEYLTVFGQYIIKPALFEYLEEHIRNNVRERGEFQLTSALDRLRKEDGFLGLIIEGQRYDIGLPEYYLETLKSFAEQ